MRAKVTFADDVAAAVEELRRNRGIGVSDAVNELVRAGLLADRPRQPFRQQTHDLGAALDVSDVGAALERLDRPAAR
jgi:hypothetical protein